MNKKLILCIIATQINAIIENDNSAPMEHPVAAATILSQAPMVMAGMNLPELFAAAIHGDLPVLNLALSRLNVNSRDEMGYTALMLAIIHGQADAVSRILREPGINLDIVNYYGKTALDIAKEIDNQLFVDLIEARMDELGLPAVLEPMRLREVGVSLVTPVSPSTGTAVNQHIGQDVDMDDDLFN